MVRASHVGYLPVTALHAPAPAALRAPVRAAPSLFDQIYRAHIRFVTRSVRRLGVADGDVEDQCQVVFEVVHRQLPGFRGESKLSTWLFGIVYRVVSDYRRSAYHRRIVLGEQPEVARPPEQTAGLEQADARAVLDQLLVVLDDDKRAAFVLCELEGLEVKEAAEMFGVPAQTVYSRLRAARHKLEEAARRLQSTGAGR